MRKIIVMTVSMLAIWMPNMIAAQEKSDADLKKFVERVEAHATNDPEFVTKVTALLDAADKLELNQPSGEPPSEMVPLPAGFANNEQSKTEPAASTNGDEVDVLRQAVSTLHAEVAALKKELSKITQVGGLTESGGFLEGTRCRLIVKNQQPYSVDLDLAFTDIMYVPKTVRVTVPPLATHEVIVHTAEGKEAIAIKLPQNRNEKPRLFRLDGPEHSVVIPIYPARTPRQSTVPGTTIVQRQIVAAD